MTTRLTFFLALVCLMAMAQEAALMPPLPPTNVFVGRFPPPKKQNVVTNITLSFDPYTNVWFNVYASTNLQTWYLKTNIPVWKTNITLPMTAPQEFYFVQVTNT